MKKGKDFKFEAFWVEDPECLDVVSKAWNMDDDGDEKIVVKLGRVTKELQLWSKQKFTNNSRRIKELNQELQVITNSSNSSFEKNKMQSIKRELKDIWRREEMY